MEPKDEYLRKALAHRTRLAGAHADKRTKRARTRSAAERRAINQQKEDK